MYRISSARKNSVYWTITWSRTLLSSATSNDLMTCGNIIQCEAIDQLYKVHSDNIMYYVLRLKRSKKEKKNGKKWQ